MLAPPPLAGRVAAAVVLLEPVVEVAEAGRVDAVAQRRRRRPAERAVLVRRDGLDVLRPARRPRRAHGGQRLDEGRPVQRYEQRHRQRGRAVHATLAVDVDDRVRIHRARSPDESYYLRQ